MNKTSGQRRVLLLSCVRALARQSEVITGQDIERHLTMVRPQAPAVCTPEPAAAPATLVAPVAPAPVVEESAPEILACLSDVLKRSKGECGTENTLRAVVEYVFAGYTFAQVKRFAGVCNA